LAAVPTVPEDQPLAVGADGGDEVGRAGDAPQRLVRAGVVGDELVVEANAVHRAVLTGEEQADLAEPRERAGRADAAGAALVARDLERLAVERANRSVLVYDMHTGIVGN